MDIMMLLDALAGAASGGLQGYQIGNQIQQSRRRQELEEREMEQRAEADRLARDQQFRQWEAGRMDALNKTNMADQHRRRLATGNRAILDATPEGAGIVGRLGPNADDVLGEYDPSSLDDLIRQIRPPAPKPEAIDRLSPQGVAAQREIDENRARLRTKYPTSRGGGNDEASDIRTLLSQLNSQIDDSRMDVNRLSRPLADAEESGYDVEPADTAGLGAARANMARLTGMRDRATTALTKTSPVLAALFANDSSGVASPAPAGAVAGLTGGRSGPPRGVAQPLSEQEKLRANSDPKFRSFLMQNGYTERDWK